MPFAKLFRSRWAALLWAGGILWTAYDFADAGDSATPQAQPTLTPDQMAAVNRLGG
jgi:hypothetical protein